MAKPHHIHLLIAAAVVAAVALSADAGGGDSIWLRPPTCRGSIAECMGEGEFAMDSEINRRILANGAGKTYLSYRALERDQIPCSRIGQSYYNCKPGKVNPYIRTCTVATQCRTE